MSAILRVKFFNVNYCMYFSTAEAVLQEMDNINIRRNRRSGEVERLRMWTDTEFVSAQCLRSLSNIKGEYGCFCNTFIYSLDKSLQILVHG